MNEDMNDLIIPTEESEAKNTVRKESKNAKEAKGSKKDEPKKAIPRLFFKKDDRIEIAVNGYHSNDTGELSFVIPMADGDDTGYDNDELNRLFTKATYRFWFTRIPYDKLNRYRTRSMIYNSEDQNNTINNLRLREYFLVFHLVDWDLADEDGKKIELKFDPNGALSDECLKLIYTLPPNLIDTVLTSFEKKVLI